MKYMLDTNICIYAIKNKPEKVLENLRKHKPEDICISSITYAELVHGVEKSQAVLKNRIALTLLLSNIEIMPFDADAANHYGNIRAILEKKSQPIGNMEMLIAAHARALGCNIVTNNTREFQKVDGLTIENWTE